MNKKIIFPMVGIIVILIIAVASYFWNPIEQKQTSNQDESKSASIETKKSQEQSKDTIKGFDKDKAPNFEDTLKSNDPDLEEVEKIKNDNTIESIEGFSKEEIVSAGEFVSDYIYEAHSNTYFLGGEWGNNGSDIKQLQGILGRYYSKEIVDTLDKYENNKNNQEFAKKVTGMIPYFNDTTTYSPSKYCIVSKETAPLEKIEDGEGFIVDNFNDCPISLKLSEITYKSVNKGNSDVLEVYFKTDATYPLFSKELNSDAEVDANYDYSLVLAPKFAEDKDEPEWEITAYNVDVNFSKIKQMER